MSMHIKEIARLLNVEARFVDYTESKLILDDQKIVHFVVNGFGSKEDAEAFMEIANEAYKAVICFLFQERIGVYQVVCSSVIAESTVCCFAINWDCELLINHEYNVALRKRMNAVNRCWPNYAHFIEASTWKKLINADQADRFIC